MKKKIRRICVAVCAMMVGVVFAVAVPRANASNGSILFVSDRDEPGNWDIYAIDLSSGVITRLTYNPAIDNHPDLSPDGTKVVFSSTRGAGVDFDIYIADISDVDGTASRLTDDSYPNGPQTHYPDRHCHFSPADGSLIVFSSKNRPLDHPIEVASECSVPIIIFPPRFYENLNLIKVDAAGNIVSYVELDIRDAWDKVTYPDIWRDDNATYVGHPSFSPDGSKIVFSAAIDGDGTVWEVYTVDIEIVSLSLVANSLQRITNGSLYPPNPNPIQMSGGAHFTADGSNIIFSSTRPTLGNSQLFWAYPTETDLPVQESRRLTSHLANDYVPEPLDDGRVVFVSDRGLPSMCDLPPDVEGPTMDLDIFIMNPDGSGQTNLTDNDTADEMLLIGDEVSWFCGLKPNLSSCTYQPRIFDMEALWLMRYADIMIPPDLLQRFNIPDARPLYTTYWNNLQEYVATQSHLESTWAEIYIQAEWLMSTFPGFEDPRALQNWMMQTAQIRDQLFVLPSIMLEDGIGEPVSIDSLQIEGNYTVNIFGVGELTFQVAGPTVIQRSDPMTDPDTGLHTIETEILSMDLVGANHLGPVRVRGGRDFGLTPSKGKIILKNIVEEFPAESFFDVFYEIEVGDMLSPVTPVTPGTGTDTKAGATILQSQQESSLILQNQEPFRMEATINEIPLTDVTFVTSPEQQPVSLIDVTTGQVVGELIICTWNPPILEVDIDIKPGSYPNSINLKSKGVIPVAILTTAQFDASRVDPETVALAGSLALRSSMEDVDEDGDPDMVLHVATQGLNLTADSTEATLTGKTLDATKIKGTDSVRIVPSKK